MMMSKGKIRIKKAVDFVKSWLKEHPGWVAISCGVAALIGSLFFHYVYGENFPSIEYVRNIIFILAGIGAFYGLHMRTEQLKLGRKTQVEANISRAVKQTDSESLSIRCVGVRLLQSIVDENPEKTQIVTDILMHFVEGRCPIKVDENMKASEEDVSEMHELDDPDRPYWPDPIDRRECKDVEIALRVLGEIIPEEKRKEVCFFGIDIRGLDLNGMNFRGFEFFNVRLCESDLSDADLRRAQFTDCYMDDVNFSSAKLQKAVFRYINFKGAKFYSTIFEETDCSYCDFRQTLQRTQLGSQNPVEHITIWQRQVDKMVYSERSVSTRFVIDRGIRSLPKLPPGLDLPESGAYGLGSEEVDGRFQLTRQLKKSGKFLEPVFPVPAAPFAASPTPRKPFVLRKPQR